MSDPVQPKPAIPLAEFSEPVQPKTPVPWWRWVVAILLAPVVFMMSLLPIGILCGQQFNDIPDRWAFVPIIGQLAFGLGVTIWALRGVVRPKPRKQRGFPIQVHSAGLTPAHCRDRVWWWQRDNLGGAEQSS